MGTVKGGNSKEEVNFALQKKKKIVSGFENAIRNPYKGRIIYNYLSLELETT